MSRNNDVCKVLFLPDITGAQIDADKRVGDLKSGTFDYGIFNYDTGKSVHVNPDGSDFPARWFLATIGGGTDALPGTFGEIYTTTGTHIQTKNVRYVTEDEGQDAVGQEISISNTNIQSGPDATQYDYGFKLDFRGNTEVYQRFGMNQATKFFMGSTKCVGKEVADDVYADAEVAAQWAAGIAADTDKFLGLSTTGDGNNVDYTLGIGWTINGAEATEADALKEIRNYTDNLVFKVYIQDFSKMQYFCNVNPKYFKQRQIKAIPSLIGGSCKWADIKETVPMKYESGYGYDINELEYLAGGFTGKPGPYRQSRLHGLAFNNVEFIAKKDNKYSVTTLGYDQFSVGGWLEYLNNQSTYLVAPDAGTSGDLANILAALLATTGIIKIITPV